MRHALPSSLSPCVLALGLCLAGASTPLRADEDVKPIVIEGKLAKDDPRDAVRKASGHKVHEVKLEAGKCYQIDLSSKDFDPFLRLEDDKKTQLGFNDDIDYAAKNLDARLCVAPLRAGTYRLVVTSFEGGATGAYQGRVQALVPGGTPVVAKRGLGKESHLTKGRFYFELLSLSLNAGEVQVAEVVSEEFAPRLLLVDAQGKPVLDGVVREQGKGRARLVVAAVRPVRCQLVVTTAAAGESGAYAWRLATYRSPSQLVADKGKADRAAVAAAHAHAEGLKKQGRLAEALAAYERVVQLAQQAFGPEHLDTATLMGNLARLHQEQGQYPSAELLYQRSLAIRERRLGKQHIEVATSLNNLVTLYLDQGEYGKGEPLCRRSLAIFENELGKDHPSVATGLNNLAELYRAQGQGARAGPLYQRSAAIYEAKLGKNHPFVALSLNNLALLYQAQGQYGKAEPLYQRSLAIFESTLGKDHPDVANGLNNLAMLYQAQGQFGRAESLLQRSVAILESQPGKDHPRLAASLHNLAAVYWAQNDNDRAESLFRRSLAIRESKLGKDHPDVALSLNNLAALYEALGQYRRAEPLLLRSLAIYESKLGKDHPSVARTLNNLAELYREQGQYPKAEPLCRRSVAILESQLGKDHPDVATGLNSLVLLYEAQDKGPQAIEALDHARRGLRRYLHRELGALPARHQLTFLHTEATGGFHLALSLAWRLRARDAVRRPSAAWLINGQALAHEALAEQLLRQRDSAGQPWAPFAAQLHEVRSQLAALTVQTPSPQKRDAHRRLLAELDAREEALARRVAHLSGRDRRAAWLELDELRKALPSDTALVALARFNVFKAKATSKEYPWGPPRYAAWIIDAKEVQIVDLGTAGVVEEEVQGLGRELRAGSAVQRIQSEGEPDAEKLLRRHLDKVSRRVLHPLLPHLEGKARWLVCPDGALWLVPWAALTLPDGKYVVEKHTVSHLVSGRDVIPVDSKAKPSAPVVLADPDFDLTPGKPAGGKAVTGEDADDALTRSLPLGAVRFGRLPGTAAEARRIAPKLRAYAGESPTVYTGAEATEAAFKALKGPKVLVLATHGFFLPDVERKPDDDFLRQRPERPARPEENPLLRSGVALAGANARAAAAMAGVDDGILTALEILQTDLRGTELVVLSACETGLGEVRNGEGVAGLRQAFQLAGAQSVLATFWQIPDRQTAQLMGKFFDHLAAGRGRTEALRLAQLEMIRVRRQREGAAHPFYWAAFTLTGNWR